jgi:hypothetical protein
MEDKYTILRSILLEDEDEEFANDMSEWPDEFLGFTDNLSDWAYAFADIDDLDEGVIPFYFAPNSDELSDEYFPYVFAEKLLQPHFKQQISELMDSCFEIESISESEIESIMTKLGVTKRPRNWS